LKLAGQYVKSVDQYKYLGIVGEIRDLWAKTYILFDAISAACRKWLKVGFQKVQRVPIILVPKSIITSE